MSFTDFNVVVVDNASQDGSAAFIAQRFPKVRLVRNKTNRGLTKALNQAIALGNAPYIQIMHPDVVVRKDTFSQMIPFMETHHNVAALGCKVKHPTGKIFPSAHRFPRPTAFVLDVLHLPKGMARRFHLYGLFMRQMNFNKLQEVDIVASAFLLLRRHAFAEAGMFDERFTNWTSEWDLCYRLKEQGWRIVYYPGTEVVHYESYLPVGRMKFTKEIEYKFKRGYVVADKVQQMLFLFYRKQ